MKGVGSDGSDQHSVLFFPIYLTIDRNILSALL